MRAYRADLQRWLQDSAHHLDAVLEAYCAAHSWAASPQNRKRSEIERFPGGLDAQTDGLIHMIMAAEQLP